MKSKKAGKNKTPERRGFNILGKIKCVRFASLTHGTQCYNAATKKITH